MKFITALAAHLNKLFGYQTSDVGDSQFRLDDVLDVDVHEVDGGAYEVHIMGLMTPTDLTVLMDVLKEFVPPQAHKGTPYINFSVGVKFQDDPMLAGTKGAAKQLFINLTAHKQMRNPAYDGPMGIFEDYDGPDNPNQIDRGSRLDGTPPEAIGAGISAPLVWPVFKRKVIDKDFEDWSGGFTPDECERHQLETYANSREWPGISSHDVLDYLMHWGGMIPK